MSQMTAVLDQVSSSTAAAPAPAAAVAASDTGLAAVAAASRLAIFFPQTHLLTLTQTVLSCHLPDPSSDSSIGCMAKLGLGLAEALISTWTEQKDWELQRSTVPEGADWDDGSGAAWSDIIKGLLRMTLVSASSSTETEADVLLLTALRQNRSWAFHRYLSFPLLGEKKGGGGWRGRGGGGGGFLQAMPGQQVSSLQWYKVFIRRAAIPVDDTTSATCGCNILLLLLMA